MLKTIASLRPGNVIAGYRSLSRQFHVRDSGVQNRIENLIWGGRIKMVTLCLIIAALQVGVAYLQSRTNSILLWAGYVDMARRLNWVVQLVMILRSYLISPALFFILFGLPISRFIKSKRFARDFSNIPTAEHLLYIPILSGLFKRQLLVFILGTIASFFYVLITQGSTTALRGHLQTYQLEANLSLPFAIAIAIVIKLIFSFMSLISALILSLVLITPYITGKSLFRSFCYFFLYALFMLLLSRLFLSIANYLDLFQSSMHLFFMNIIYKITLALPSFYILGLILNSLDSSYTNEILSGSKIRDA